jgi:hypothetical protein
MIVNTKDGWGKKLSWPILRHYDGIKIGLNKVMNTLTVICFPSLIFQTAFYEYKAETSLKHSVRSALYCNYRVFESDFALKPMSHNVTQMLTAAHDMQVTFCWTSASAQFCHLWCFVTKHSFCGLVVSMLASGTQDRGFEPGRNRRIFGGEKILSMPSFGGKVNPSVPCRRFAACKRTL